MAFRQANALAQPDWHNAPVPSFGTLNASLLIVGLAPGLKGANATGRPFTGDYAGDLLYATLLKFGFAKGPYGAHAGDGLKLVGARITNAVRCVPPQNKPLGPEIRACAPFLTAEIAAMKHLKVIVTLGNIAHGAVLNTVGLKLKEAPFGHANEVTLPKGPSIIASYHCSRLNTNTRRLTPAMFEDIFARARERLAGN
ncbi:MAG: uracil-DNA glycosylase family 4 [Alphaproteobacteria bacterium]